LNELFRNRKETAKYTWGPVGRKKEGPFPPFFLPTPPAELFESLFGRILPRIAAKKETKVKKWPNENFGAKIEASLRGVQNHL
jgi:hypothetical protein